MSADPSAGAMNVPAASSPPPSALPSGGGAWEAIIDKAVAQVTEYLTTSTREFDPTAALSRHMLHLLDRGTLRDIVVERNYNELCGCLGCGNKPRGLLWNVAKGNGGTLSFDWPSSSSSTSDGENDEAEEEENGENTKEINHRSSSATQHLSETNKNMNNNASSATATSQAEDNEEIVYEDDLYTAESFRLARRQCAMLNRMQRKRLQNEKKISAPGQPSSSASAAASAAATSSPRVRRSGMLGASFPQRFCSAECEDLFESGITPRVSPYLSFDFPSVFSALTNLFPNLSVASLQQLAGAEVSASWLVQPVKETGVVRPRVDAAVTAATTTEEEEVRDTLKPVQVGVSYESTLHLHHARPRSTPSSECKSTRKVSFQDRANTDRAEERHEQQPQLLRTVLEQMQVLQGVWNHEVVPRFSESHLPRVPAARNDASDLTGSETHVSAASAAPSPSMTAAVTEQHPRPVLRGSLLVFDFIMNTSGARTRRLFCLHYAKHRTALQANISRATAAAAEGRATSFFFKVSVDIVAAMEEKYTRMHACSGQAERDDVKEDIDDIEDELRIDPALQQQRRELLTAHIFSEEVTATLSRLLMVDYVLLINVAWSGVWFRELPLRVNGAKEECSLLRSLRFPFAIPAVLLRAAGSSPEVMGLAMIYVVAAGCCSTTVWEGCMADEVAFDEVADAIGLTAADVTAAVRSLMLGEEDE